MAAMCAGCAENVEVIIGDAGEAIHAYQDGGVGCKAQRIRDMIEKGKEHEQA